MSLRARFDEAAENFKTNEIVKRVKLHLTENKKAYITGASVAGITWTMMRSSTARGAVRVNVNARGAFGNTASFSFKNKQTVNVINVIQRTGPGHPGYPVVNLETGRFFSSQSEAAKTFNIPEKVLSAHLHEKFPDVDGWHFKYAELRPA